MSSIEKLIETFKKSPASLTYFEIKKILVWLGFSEKQGKGSHVKFNEYVTNTTIIIPVHNNDCKKVYKQEIKKILIRNGLL